MGSQGADALHEPAVAEGGALPSDFHREVLCSCPDGLVIIDRGGTVRFANARAEALFGAEVEGLVGLPIEALIPQRSRDKHEHHVARDFANLVAGPQSVMNIGVRASRVDGAEFTASISLSPLAIGGEQWVSASVREAAGVELVLNALRTTEERFEASVESLKEALCIFTAVRDDAGHIVDFVWEFANSAVRTATGFAPEALIGRALLAVLPGHGPSGLLDAYRTVVESGEPWQDRALRYEDTWADGTRAARTFDVRVTKVADGVVAVLRDVTDERAREEMLALRTAELEVSNASLEATSRAMTKLAKGTDALQRCSRLDEAMEIMSRAAPLVFEGVAGAVFCPAPAGNAMVIASSWGGFEGRSLIQADDCWALRSAACHMFGQDQLALRCRHTPPAANHSICIPIVAQGEIFALICVQSCPSDPRGVSDLAEVLHAQWGLTLLNLRLRESLREQSLRDPLTGLFNRRYLDEVLEHEVHRAEREGAALGVVMLDLDLFKAFNDAHGHPGGDILLRDFGRFLLEVTRGSDVVGRFGGEEFLLILPGMTPQSAPARMEGLLSKWRQRIAESDSPEGFGFPTVSAGLAYFSPGVSASDLVAAADRALYRAKAAGRDRVEIEESAAPMQPFAGAPTGGGLVVPLRLG